jgi:hypothetical protein
MERSFIFARETEARRIEKLRNGEIEKCPGGGATEESRLRLPVSAIREEN